MRINRRFWTILTLTLTMAMLNGCFNEEDKQPPVSKSADQPTTTAVKVPDLMPSVVQSDTDRDQIIIDAACDVTDGEIREFIEKSFPGSTVSKADLENGSYFFETTDGEKKDLSILFMQYEEVVTGLLQEAFLEASVVGEPMELTLEDGTVVSLQIFELEIPIEEEECDPCAIMAEEIMELGRLMNDNLQIAIKAHKEKNFEARDTAIAKLIILNGWDSDMTVQLLEIQLAEAAMINDPNHETIKELIPVVSEVFCTYIIPLLLAPSDPQTAGTPITTSL